METNESKNIELKKVYLFKHFVEFLKIYGQEQYGTDDVNYAAVYNFIIKHNIFSFNDDLDNVVLYGEETLDSEEFKFKVFSFIEKQAIDNYPLFRLFHMSKWLNEKLEQELNNLALQEQKNIFNKSKCYKCVHYTDEIKALYKMRILRIEEILKINPNIDLNNLAIRHAQNCCKRMETRLSYEENQSSCFHSIENFKKYMNKNKIDYPKMWVENPYEYSSGVAWEFRSLSNREKCPYYEENKNMNFEEFIKKYYEVVANE